MRQGLKPEAGDERQSDAKLTFAFPESTAIEIRRRVKARRRKEPHFSRNDFMRIVVLDYFKRHPFTESENGGGP